MGDLKILYENYYEIRKIPIEDSDEEINVHNSLLSEDKEKLMKVTNIVVGNKRIRITDIYHFVRE